jgi:phosphatidylglycerophosphate synthase
MSSSERESGQIGRFLGVTGGLLAWCALLSMTIERRYGRTAGRRFRRGMAAAVALQQFPVWLAVRRSARNGKAHRLSVVDAMTLSRAATGALLTGLVMSGIRDRRGMAGWLGWLAVLYGAILCDWLDGPIARRLGSSEIGAMFDLEADSWVTLCTSAACVTWGELPLYVMVSPLARYALLGRALQRMAYSEATSGHPRWERHTGIAQMLLYIAALAPFGGRLTRPAVRRSAPIIASVQVLSLVEQHRRKMQTGVRPE